jgi:predicted anti-sigma-YlaC factor YlaD
MTHLTPDELVDAVEHTLAPERREHLTACAHCRHEVADAAAMLQEATSVNTPEPSPLFWDHLADRVRAAVAADVPPARARRWFDWPVLVPCGALAVLVLVLVSSIPLSVSPLDELATGTRAVGSDLADATDNEDRWAVMFDLVGEVDLDAVVDSGLVGRPGSAERVLAHLTPNEQEELVRLLREELRSGG